MTNQNIPIINLGLSYVNGLNISYLNNKKFSLSSGMTRDSTNINDILVLLENIIVDGSIIGINGVDIFPLIANKFYAVYIIGNSNSNPDNPMTAALLSLNPIQPLLPFDFDMYRRIGWVLTDSSANILKFYQYGTNEQRTYYYDVAINVLTEGSSTIFTSIDLSSCVPPIATEVLLKLIYSPDTNNNISQFLPYGSTAINGIIVFGYGPASDTQVDMLTVPTQLNGTSPQIQYKVMANDTLTVAVAGYKDYL
jgi:hypothetical protein